jgi:hypothetical protein
MGPFDGGIHTVRPCQGIIDREVKNARFGKWWRLKSPIPATLERFVDAAQLSRFLPIHCA